MSHVTCQHINSRWVDESFEQKRHVPLEPTHMLHLSMKRKAEFSQTYDRYEDSYSRNLSDREYVCVCERETKREPVCVSVFMCVCLCVCVFVCVCVDCSGSFYLQ